VAKIRYLKAPLGASRVSTFANTPAVVLSPKLPTTTTIRHFRTHTLRYAQAKKKSGGPNTCISIHHNRAFIMARRALAAISHKCAHSGADRVRPGW